MKRIILLIYLQFSYDYMRQNCDIGKTGHEHGYKVFEDDDRDNDDDEEETIIGLSSNYKRCKAQLKNIILCFFPSVREY